MYCAQCGTKSGVGANFCVDCGAKISAGTQGGEPSKTSTEYVSPYEGEEILFSIRGRNDPDKRVFPGHQESIPLLGSKDCDIYYTTKRLCLVMGNPNVRDPAPTNLFVPLLGGAVLAGIGTLATLVMQDAIDAYRKKKFKAKHGDGYPALAIDIMGMAGNAIYSKGPLHAIIFKEKPGFFNTIGNDKKHMNVAFIGNYQYQDQVLKGCIIRLFVQDLKGELDLLRRQEGLTYEIADTFRNDADNLRYIENLLRSQNS